MMLPLFARNRRDRSGDLCEIHSSEVDPAGVGGHSRPRVVTDYQAEQAAQDFQSKPVLLLQ